MKNFKRHCILTLLVINCLTIFSVKAKAFNSINPSHTIKASMIETEAPKNRLAQNPLTKKELLDRIKKVVSKEFSVKPENIKMQSDFAKDFGADDLDGVELIMAFEEEFKISISDKDAESLTTVQKTYDYLVKKLKITK